MLLQRMVLDPALIINMLRLSEQQSCWVPPAFALSSAFLSTKKL